VKLLQQSSEFGVPRDCSGGVLFPQGCTLHSVLYTLPTGQTVMRLLPGKSFSWEKSWDKAVPDGCQFKKFYTKIILKLKIHMIWNTSFIYCKTKLYAVLPNLVRLSL
jgi:hypothetical protein